MLYLYPAAGLRSRTLLGAVSKYLLTAFAGALVGCAGGSATPAVTELAPLFETPG